MKLSEETKNAIQAEYDSWKDLLWAGKSLKERQALGQFATPPQLVFKMLEKFDTLQDKDVLDPCLGAGNLIVGAILAGADPSRCYGIELDPDVLVVARRRLSLLGVPPCNLVQGNALDPSNYEIQDGSSFKTFATVSKQDGTVTLSIVKDSKLAKQVKYTDKAKLKNMLDKLLKKGIKVFKV